MNFAVILAGSAAVAWFLLLARLLLVVGRVRPIVPVEGDLPGDSPTVEAIVAARNEERDVEACVRSLLAQEYPNLTIIVVDDLSTDSTGSILDRLAAEPNSIGRLRVIQGVPRPEGWVGKTWAVHQARIGVSADWIWFVDGDMKLHPRALATAWSEASREGADLVSVLPETRAETFWQATTTLAVACLLTHLFPLSRVNDPRKKDLALAAGGFLFVRRSLYEKVGGHEAVRSEIVEDIELARLVKKAGGKLRVAPCSGLASTHMYGNLGEIWRGLRKNAYAILDYRPFRLGFGVLMALAMAWIPPIAAISGLILMGKGVAGASRLAMAGGIGWTLMALSILPFVVVMGLPIWHSLCFPGGVTLYSAIASSSAWHHGRGRIMWKGVTYDSRAVEAAGRPGRGRGDGAGGSVPEPHGGSR